MPPFLLLLRRSKNFTSNVSIVMHTLGALSLTIRLIFSLLCSLPRSQCFTLKKHASRQEPQPGVFAILRAYDYILAMAPFNGDLGSHHRAQECGPPTYISMRVTARDYELSPPLRSPLLQESLEYSSAL